MVASTPRLILAALLLLPVAVGQAAPKPRTDLPITVEAQSSDFDYKNGVLVFSHVVITQGDARVEADHATATGLNFESSRWRLEGNVEIKAEGGSLASDLATVNFQDNEISVAQVVGAPAHFSQKRDDRSAEGRANQIDYDLASGRVRLSGGAWLSDGSNEITGTTLVYSLREERVVAEAGEQGGKPVRITINPKAPPGAEPEKKPGTGP
jgi:lipopolysaccharide transport protein LptA